MVMYARVQAAQIFVLSDTVFGFEQGLTLVKEGTAGSGIRNWLLGLNSPGFS